MENFHFNSTEIKLEFKLQSINAGLGVTTCHVIQINLFLHFTSWPLQVKVQKLVQITAGLCVHCLELFCQTFQWDASGQTYG